MYAPPDPFDKGPLGLRAFLDVAGIKRNAIPIDHCKSGAAAFSEVIEEAIGVTDLHQKAGGDADKHRFRSFQADGDLRDGFVVGFEKPGGVAHPPNRPILQRKREPMSAEPDVLNQTAQSQLKSIIDRVERLDTEKSEISEQIKEVFAEAKGNGFDVKVLKKVIALRKQDRAKRMEEEAIMDLYLSAIGEV